MKFRYLPLYLIHCSAIFCFFLVHYQGFAQKNYTQLNTTEFIGGLSIVDVLMNCGLGKTIELISNGENKKCERTIP